MTLESRVEAADETSNSYPVPTMGSDGEWSVEWV